MFSWLRWPYFFHLTLDYLEIILLKFYENGLSGYLASIDMDVNEQWKTIQLYT
jgi:hypothetical protein